MLFPTDADREIYKMNKEEFLKIKKVDDLDSVGDLACFDVTKDEFDKFCEIVNKTTSTRLLTEMKIYLRKNLMNLYSTIIAKRKTKRKIEDQWNELTEQYLKTIEEQESVIISGLRTCAYEELNRITKETLWYRGELEPHERTEIVETVNHLIYRIAECKSAEQIFLILIDGETLYLN